MPAALGLRRGFPGACVAGRGSWPRAPLHRYSAKKLPTCPPIAPPAFSIRQTRSKCHVSAQKWRVHGSRTLRALWSNANDGDRRPTSAARSRSLTRDSGEHIRAISCTQSIRSRVHHVHMCWRYNIASVNPLHLAWGDTHDQVQEAVSPAPPPTRHQAHPSNFLATLLARSRP